MGQAANSMKFAAAELLGLTENDFACPICMSMIKDPFVTECGHSFCFQCITTHLVNKKSCPCCSIYMTADKVHPNFLLHKVVGKLSQADLGSATSPAERVVQLLEDDKAGLKLGELNRLLQILWDRKLLLEQQDAETNLQLLLHFLRHSRQEKSKQLTNLQSELQLLDSDIKQVAGRHPAPPAGKVKSPHLPSRQHSTQLLDKRLQEAMLNTTDTPDQAAAASAAHATDDRPAAATQAAAVALSQATHVSAGAAVRAPSSLLTPTSSTATLTAPVHQYLVQSSQSNTQQPSTQPGIILAQPGLPLQPGSSTPNQQGRPPQQPVTGAAARPDQSRQPRLARASNGYLMINHPYPSPLAASQQVADGAVTAAASAHGSAAAGASATRAAARIATPVPMPTQMERQQSMHIHPRHLAFQHFHAQQQRQQVERQSAASHAAGASGAAATQDQAATQEAALRARRRRVLSQFEDLQQCYLRLRKSGKTPAAAAGLPRSPFQEDAIEVGGNEPPSKRLRQEHQPQSAMPMECTLSTDPLEAGQGAEAGVSPAEASGSFAAASQVDSDRPSTALATAGVKREASEAFSGGQPEPSPASSQAPAPAVTGPADEDGLAEFSRMLSVFTHCGRLKVVAQLLRPSNQHSSSILSSIEFDRDSEVFATAGVSKRISIYEYSAIMANPAAETHRPSQELVTRSKLSCLTWNKYLKTHLASSDYEGVVHVWDIATGQNVAEYEAHEKRIWSVDFCHVDPKLLMSGSDDGMVKIWSTSQPNPVSGIDVKANVCCAKYNPGSSYEIAVGAADHTVLTYDLRKSDRPVHTFRGHRKAVSYVRYLNGTELVSASTDSTLRLWDTKACTAGRVFSGHNNEKNFVGLSVDGDFMACGSETNEVYVYYKAMSKPVCRRFFSTAAEVANSSHNQDPSQFISAVCWKPHSQILLSANSQGTIKLMQLTS